MFFFWVGLSLDFEFCGVDFGLFCWNFSSDDTLCALYVSLCAESQHFFPSIFLTFSWISTHLFFLTLSLFGHDLSISRNKNRCRLSIKGIECHWACRVSLVCIVLSVCTFACFIPAFSNKIHFQILFFFRFVFLCSSFRNPTFIPCSGFSLCVFECNCVFCDTNFLVYKFHLNFI